MAPRPLDEPSKKIANPTTADEGAPVPRLHESTGEDRELFDDGAPLPIDDRVLSGGMNLYPDLIPLPLPDHLRLLKPKELQAILSRAILTVIFNQSPENSFVAPFTEIGPLQRLMRAMLPQSAIDMWDSMRERKESERLALEIRRRCDALAGDIIQGAEEVPGSGQRMMYFPQGTTKDGIAFSGRSVNEILTQMQEEPVPYIPTIDSQDSDVVEILEWSSAEPTGAVYQMKFRNRKGEIKEQCLVLASKAYVASGPLNSYHLRQATIVTTGMRTSLDSIWLDERLFYIFESGSDPNKLLNFRRKIHEYKVTLLKCQPSTLELEDDLPFGFVQGDSHNLDIFYAPSLDPEKNQQMHRYIWLGNEVDLGELEGYVEAIKNHEEFASRQGLDRTLIETFSGGLAVRLPPYVDAKCVRRFKIHLMDYLERKRSIT